jgi:hypothetical protein
VRAIRWFLLNRFFNLWVAAVGNFIRWKRILGGSKAYLRVTDHTYSNIISREKRILVGLKAYLRATDHTYSNIISRDISARRLWNQAWTWSMEASDMISFPFFSASSSTINWTVWLTPCLVFLFWELTNAENWPTLIAYTS